MTKIYGYIFNLNGVVTDTAKYHFLAWKRLAGWRRNLRCVE